MRTSKVAEETVIAFSDAKAELGVAPATVRKWTRRGVLCPNGDRCCLDWCKIGGKPVTSREAVARFVRSSNQEEGKE